jgi:hypothetical protein
MIEVTIEVTEPYSRSLKIVEELPVEPSGGHTPAQVQHLVNRALQRALKAMKP